MSESPTAQEIDIDALYRSHGHLVMRRAQAILGDESEAHEILQEIFLMLLREPASFNGRSSPATWLYRVTTNRCLNRLRDRQNRARLLSEHVEPMVAEARQDSPVRWLQAQQFMSRMPDELAQVVIYYSIDGMTHEEIAETLGCSRRHVGNLLRRAQMWAQAQEMP